MKKIFLLSLVAYFCFQAFKPLYALDKLWETNIDRSSNNVWWFVDSDQSIIAVDKNNIIHCLNSQSGKRKWKYSINTAPENLLMDDLSESYKLSWHDKNNQYEIFLQKETGKIIRKYSAKIISTLEKNTLILPDSLIIKYLDNNKPSPFLSLGPNIELNMYLHNQNLTILARDSNYPSTIYVVNYKLPGGTITWSQKFGSSYASASFDIFAHQKVFDVKNSLAFRRIESNRAIRLYPKMTVYENTLYFILPTEIIALDQNSGKGKWISKTFNNILDISNIKLYDDFAVIIVETEKEIHGLNSQSGDLLWSFKKTCEICNPIYVIKNLILFVGKNKMFTINPLDGSQIWSFTNDFRFCTEPLNIGDDIVISDGNNFLLFDFYTGKLLYQLNIYEAYQIKAFHEFILETDNLFIYRTGYDLIAINKNHLFIEWKTPIKNSGTSYASPFWLNQVPFRVYYADNNEFFVLNEKGKKLCEKKLSDNQVRTKNLTIKVDLEHNILFEYAKNRITAYHLE